MSNFFDGGTILVLLISIVLVGIFCTASGIMWWEEYKRERYMEEWMKLHGPPTEDSTPNIDEEMEK